MAPAQTNLDDEVSHLHISELFYSIQGESTFAGYPCAFIRLAGCNLRCSYCDARYTYEEQPLSLPLGHILSFTEKYPTAIVEITGGEPLLQQEVYLLMEKLIQAKRVVLLETNGSILLDKVPAAVIKIMDIKCPDSGMSDRMNLHNIKLLSPVDEIKFVLSSRTDFDWAVQVLNKNFPHLADKDASRRPQILFSPVTSALEPSLLAQWILDKQLPVRLQLQLHSQLWPKQKRGV